MINFDKSIYELISEEKLEDIGSTGYIFKHKKSGARVVLVSNDDENKVFTVGFRTPPENSTGVAHILEHSVLCGSRKYPAKDPFVELAKGSLNTYLNAMTFPDKTLYPVGSYNDVDFKNLTDVYLDAVFYPNIYTRPQIFKQEGWHYELESPEGELIYNGVVYNEMKGAFSSGSGKIDRICKQSLFPDTAYATESGGDPQCIPNLSYEEFLAFHKKLYHPSNSYIYIYGNCDMSERLEYLDREYLSAFDKIEIDSKLEMQKPFEKSVRVCEKYSVTQEEGVKDKTYLAYNTVVGTSDDSKLALAFAVLEYALFTSSGAPVKQALIDAGIGEDVSGGYDRSLKQPMFSIVATNTNADREEEFVSIIKDTFAKLVKEGLDKDNLRAGINYNEFQYREADYGGFPKGLVYGLNAFDSWLHDDNKPFIHINAGDDYDYLKKMVDTDYFEQLIDKYLLKNNHSSVVVLEPEIGLDAKIDEETAKRLADYKASMSDEQLEELIADTKALKEYQSEPSPKEDLLKIPLLSRKDISREPLPFNNDIKKIGETTALHHNMNTNKIIYLNLRFSMDKVKDEDLSYVGLLTKVLGYIGTKNHSFKQLSNEIDIYTGGISCTSLVSTTVDTRKCLPAVEVRGRAVYANISKLIELEEEIICDTVFDDYKRIKEIIGEVKTSLQMRMEHAGNAVGVAEIVSQMSLSGAVSRCLSGVTLYRFLDDIYKNFDYKKEMIAKKLSQLCSQIFTRENLIVSVTADEEGFEITKEPAMQLISKLSDAKLPDAVRTISFPKRKVAYKSSGQVVYVQRGGDFEEAGFKYKGTFKILETIMSYDYLWTNVRVKGGAYGCGVSLGSPASGKSVFYSFRDPNLKATDDIYLGSADYIRNFTADEREMTKYIIGTISDLDTPKTPSQKGIRSFGAYLTNLTLEDLKKQRCEILDATQEDIRALSGHVAEVLSQDYFCVVGSEDKINAAKDMFDVIENLI